MRETHTHTNINMHANIETQKEENKMIITIARDPGKIVHHNIKKQYLCLLAWTDAHFIYESLINSTFWNFKNTILHAVKFRVCFFMSLSD